MKSNKVDTDRIVLLQLQASDNEDVKQIAFHWLYCHRFMKIKCLSLYSR